MSEEESNEDYMARERVRNLGDLVIGETAERDDLRRTFNRLRADDRIPALDAVLSLLSLQELKFLRPWKVLGEKVHDELGKAYDKPDPIDDFLKADAAAQLNTKHDAALTEIEEAHASGRIGISNALARAYILGAHRRESLSPLLADLARAVETNEADHARKRGTKIRESFLASVRANVNLLASMTAEERRDVRENEHGKTGYLGVFTYDQWARVKARALMVETWGQEAVDAALGGGS